MKTTARPAPLRFLATIYRIWMMRHVDVPDEVTRALVKQLQSGRRRGAGKRTESRSQYTPVLASVSGKSARITLVPAGGGRYRMQINTALRKAARADVGDLVGIELRLDLSPRTVPVPPDLRAGLKLHPKAWKAFEALTPGVAGNLSSGSIPLNPPRHGVAAWTAQSTFCSSGRFYGPPSHDASDAKEPALPAW